MTIWEKLMQFLFKHDKQVDQALGKAGEMAKGRFGGHGSKIDGFVNQARGMTGAGDTTHSPTPAEGAQPQPGTTSGPPAPAPIPGVQPRPGSTPG